MHSESDEDWKIEPAFDEFAAQGGRVGQVAVMGDGGPAHGKFAKEGLHIADGGRALGAGGGIADMADGQFTGQRVHDVGLGEIVADIAEAAGRVETVFGVVGDDAARLLPAMLQGVQTKGHEVGRISDADHAKNTAFLLQLVIIEGVGEEGAHGASESGDVCGP